MSIRTFRPADRRNVIALWQLSGLTRPWNDPDRDIDRKLSMSDELFLVAEEAIAEGDVQLGAPDRAKDSTQHDAGATRIIGVAMAGYDGHRGWVNYLAVHPARRGAGLGRALMHEAERRLLGLGCPKLNLQVRSGNEPVLAFYRALGYEVDATVALGKRLIIDGPGSSAGDRR